MAKSKSNTGSNYAQAKRRTSSGSQRRSTSVANSQRGPIAVVVTIIALAAIITAFILIKVNSGPSSSSVFTAKPVPTAVTSAVENIPSSALTQAGYSSAIPLPEAITGSPSPLRANGKPEVLYMGADYCPFCAAERWPLIAALSKFGTFTNLHLMMSSSTDAYPNTHTFSFYQSKYTSKYITFDGIEWATNIPTTSTNSFSGYTYLQIPSKAQQKLFTTYDNTPYISSANAGSIPFIDFGNKYLQLGASYAPSTLAGLSWQTIAGSLSLPTSATGQAIDQTTNAITATICKLTKNQPSSVCSSSVIQSIESQLGS